MLQTSITSTNSYPHSEEQINKHYYNYTGHKYFQYRIIAAWFINWPGRTTWKNFIQYSMKVRLVLGAYKTLLVENL